MCGDRKTERERYVEEHRPDRTRGGVMADRRISKRLKGKVVHDHLCDTGMPVRNGNRGNDRTTTTKAASVRKQLDTKHSIRVERADMRIMVELREDMSADELDRETGEEQITVGRTRRKDGGWRTTEESGIVRGLREDDMRRRGRPRLRWEDCVKRYVRKAGEEEDWKKKTRVK